MEMWKETRVPDLPKARWNDMRGRQFPYRNHPHFDEFSNLTVMKLMVSITH